MTNIQSYPGRIAALRHQMQLQDIDAYLIPSSDPHISEYLPERFRSIVWMSGFSGSAGTLLITKDFAGLWTDSRYFVQAADQLSGSGVELMKLRVQNAPEYADWMVENLPAGATLAFDGKSAAAQLARTLEEKLLPAGLIVHGNVDLLERIWTDRPALPQEPAFLLNEQQSGLATREKIRLIREKMRAGFANYHVVSTLDDLAWILNIRGSDVHCNPVVLGFLLIGTEEAWLFIDQSKLVEKDREQLNIEGVQLRDYQDIWAVIGELPDASALLLDPKRTCHQLYSVIPGHTKIVETTNPSTELKAQKNALEVKLTRETMIKDGIALTRFFKWLEEEMAKGAVVTEISIADRLREFRAMQDGFVGESFDTIAGYREHGALPHYKATDTSNSILERRGLLLIDSGGQYLSGTTDITRVISLGEITAAEKEDYTLVLKGMIEGSTTVFPEGTRGYQIDAITRKPLWDTKRNYGHGTGHGVGFFLNVHEGPQVFNTAAIDVPIRNGMITSIEPGLYREGQYGIRIENLVLSLPLDSNEFGDFMHFETLTLCFIATDLIERSLLDEKHISWINAYHEMVYRRLAPGLSSEEQAWLKEKTKAI